MKGSVCGLSGNFPPTWWSTARPTRPWTGRRGGWRPASRTMFASRDTCRWGAGCGARCRNFVSSLLDRAGRGEELRVVSDQKGSPTYSLDLADAVKRLLDSGSRGIFHFSIEGATTCVGYAAFLLAHTGNKEARLSALSTSDLSRDE